MGSWLLTLLFCLSAAAQDGTLSGRVTSSDDGCALPGVTVQVKGANRGTTTDANGTYRLTATSNSTLVFSFIGYVTQETVVGNRSVVNVSLVGDSQQLSEVVVIGYASSLGGRGIILISPILWNQSFFPAGDLRKAVGTATAADAAGSSGKGGYFTRKYPDATTRTENAPIIRYAEVLLNLAEALSRSGSGVDSRAVALLSAVRNRSVTTAANQYTAASFTSATDLTRAIINERRPEFLAEGMRWLDIHRLATDATFRQATGIPAKAAISITNFAPLYTNSTTTTFATEPAIPYSDYRFLWPIPLEEINNNPVLARQQNPGY